MTSYYDDIDHRYADPWVRVGWRQRLEQAYRFEVALELIDATHGTVLDVGCGLGGLACYATQRGIQRRWIGIEPHPTFAAEARATYAVVRPCRFQETDPPEVAAAVAIGTLAGLQLPAVAELVTFLGASASHFVLIVLDRDRLLERPALAGDHMIGSVTADRLREVALGSGERALVQSISTVDLALFVWSGDRPPLRTVEERFRATVDGPWGVHEPPENKAWLACELGLERQARAWLQQVEGAPALAKIVAQRMARETAA